MSDRLQITVLDEASTELRRYASNHDITAAEAVRRGLSLLLFIDAMPEHEYLGAVDERSQVVEPIDLPWRKRLARALPQFGRW
jgi:hypothetical protein